MSALAGSVQLHDITTVAERLGLHPKTVSLLIRRGELGHVRIGRRVMVRDDQLVEFIQARTVDPD